MNGKDDNVDRCPVARALLALSFAVISAQASAEALAERIQACASIGDNDRRLACFDAIASEPARLAAPEVAMTKDDAFGMEQSLMAQSRKAPDAVSQIRATVSSIRSMTNGWLVVELDNGQTWVQAEALRSPMPLAAGNQVTIRRGALGSFVLSTADRRSMRVRRKD